MSAFVYIIDWFIYLAIDYTKTSQPILKNTGKVAHRPWNKPLDFGGNPDILFVTVRVWLHTLHGKLCYVAFV